MIKIFPGEELQMKKDAGSTIKRAERFQIILIGEGLLVGTVAGFFVLLYRIVLEYAGSALTAILDFIGRDPLKMAGWFLVLMLLSWIVAKLVSFEPMISGSGIPQLEGEMVGKIDQKWRRVLPAKFLGGFLCLIGGLALGREGPSIQLGAMVGKGVSSKLDRGKTEEKFLTTCGASAGLAAAFHAPLAGVMFSLEEVHKNFSVSVLLSVMVSSLTADYLASSVMGLEPVFHFGISQGLPQEYYWMLILLGIFLGTFGAFYNWFTLKVQEIYNRATFLNTTTKIMIPFLCAGIIAFTYPELLGSGHTLIDHLTEEGMLIGTILFVLIGRFIFSAVCFGSGAPGGIFFPLLVLGGFAGGLFAAIGVRFLGLDPIYINNFVILGMAGYFAAIVRAPLTGIILIFEMTGTYSYLLSLSVVTIVAYIAATLLKSKPIYESLLERLLEKQGKTMSDPEMVNHGQKILTEFAVMQGSELEGAKISDINWPEHCLLVAIQRGTEELIPKGKTTLQMGDIIVTMTDETTAPKVHDRMEELCKEVL